MVWWKRGKFTVPEHQQCQSNSVNPFTPLSNPLPDQAYHLNKCQKYIKIIRSYSIHLNGHISLLWFRIHSMACVCVMSDAVRCGAKRCNTLLRASVSLCVSAEWINNKYEKRTFVNFISNKTVNNNFSVVDICVSCESHLSKFMTNQAAAWLFSSKWPNRKG